jgi:serine/threonine protein phosphatase PrpC
MGQNQTISAYIEYAECGVQGRRPEMEDASCIIVPFAHNQQQALFGIFDGHFGSKCSQFVAKRLPEILVRNPNFNNDPKRALKETFQAVDKEFLQWAKKDKLTDGSTAIVAVIKDKKLFVANTGDSRGVICEDGKAIALSSDHKPEVPKELERIEKSGGTLLLGRVQGRLGVARSFGDIEFKNPETLEAKYVTCEPDVEEFPITENTEFFILACDGLWDKLTNESAVDFVRERLAKRVPVSTVVKELVQEAYDKGSMDNISAILVVFTAALKKQQARKPTHDTKRPTGESDVSGNNSGVSKQVLSSREKGSGGSEQKRTSDNLKESSAGKNEASHTKTQKHSNNNDNKARANSNNPNIDNKNRKQNEGEKNRQASDGKEDSKSLKSSSKGQPQQRQQQPSKGGNDEYRTRKQRSERSAKNEQGPKTMPATTQTNYGDKKARKTPTESIKSPRNTTEVQSSPAENDKSSSN